LFPFDGKINWEKSMERLQKVNQLDWLTFELKKKSYPDVSIEEFLKTAYERAEKIKSLYDRE
jgi:hypothetical protein